MFRDAAPHSVANTRAVASLYQVQHILWAIAPADLENRAPPFVKKEDPNAARLVHRMSILTAG